MSWVFRCENWTNETRTNRIKRGDEVVATFQQARKVKLATYDEVGYAATESELPTCTQGLIAPVKTDTTGINVVYDERVQWNNITGKYVRTRVARMGVTAWETTSAETNFNAGSNE